MKNRKRTTPSFLKWQSRSKTAGSVNTSALARPRPPMTIIWGRSIFLELVSSVSSRGSLFVSFFKRFSIWVIPLAHARLRTPLTLCWWVMMDTMSSGGYGHYVLACRWISLILAPLQSCLTCNYKIQHLTFFITMQSNFSALHLEVIAMSNSEFWCQNPLQQVHKGSYCAIRSTRA